MKPSATPIRDALRRAIRRSGLKHDEIADLSGVPLMTVRRVAFGIGNQQLSTLDKLGLALDLELVSRETPDNPA